MKALNWVSLFVKLSKVRPIAMLQHQSIVSIQYQDGYAYIIHFIRDKTCSKFEQKEFSKKNGNPDSKDRVGSFDSAD